MTLFLLVLTIMIGGIAFTMAWWSMKDFQDRPNHKFYHGVYLVQHPAMVTEQSLDKLYQLLTAKAWQKLDPPIVSFERVQKGSQNSLVLFAPRQVAEALTEWGLLELEDYAPKMYAAHIHSFEAGISRNGKFSANLAGIKIFNSLGLEEDEYVFIQLVCSPAAARSSFFLTTRVVTIAHSSERRLELAKRFENNLKQQTHLGRLPKKHSSLQVYESYKKRSLYPKEVQRLVLSVSQILAILQG